MRTGTMGLIALGLLWATISTVAADTLVSDVEPVKAKSQFEGNRIWLFASFGVGNPSGNVSSIGDAVRFTSLPAKELYKSSPQFEFGFGGNDGGKRLMVDISLQGGLLWFTDVGDSVAATWRNDGRKVSSEYFTLGEVTLGWILLRCPYFAPYVAVGTGFLLQSVNSDGNDEGNGDYGLGIALKAGFDVYLGSGSPLFLRPEVRYQAVKLGVGMPRLVTYSLAVCADIGYATREEL